MEDPIKEFIDRVDRLEARYKGVKFADSWLMPAALMKAVRDLIKDYGPTSRNKSKPGRDIRG
jgi:hypothetical protein